jgi:CheY-like chemotaxis protein
VLLVDDDEEFLADLRFQLSDRVDDVLTAGSPLEAIWLLEQTPIDAVVADLVLGRGATDGLKLLDIVRRRWPRAARILVTGAGHELGERGASPAAHAVLAKPCEVSRLLALLRAPREAAAGDLAANAPLRWTITRPAPGEVLAVLQGEITEASSLPDLAPADRIVLDFAAVERINSRGVNRLRRYLAGRQDRGVHAVRCSPALVTQLTLIPALAELLTVGSAFVPLDCPGCGSTIDVLVEVPVDRQVPSVPATGCLDCAAPMEPATSPDIYFSFLIPPARASGES